MWILGRLMRLAWPRKNSSQARKFSKSNPPSKPVVWVEIYVAFSGLRDPVRFWKEAAFLGRILPKNSLGRAAWSKKNCSSPPFLVSFFFSLKLLSFCKALAFICILCVAGRSNLLIINNNYLLKLSAAESTKDIEYVKSPIFCLSVWWTIPLPIWLTAKSLWVL